MKGDTPKTKKAKNLQKKPKSARILTRQKQGLKEGNERMSENQNTEGDLFGPEVINDEAIEALSDEAVEKLLAILAKAGY